METLRLEDLRLELDGPVARAVLAAPETLNALTQGMAESLHRVCDEIEARSPEIRCLVLAAEGRGFSSGLNLRRRKPETAVKIATGLLMPLMTRLRQLRCPVVGSVRGPCVGIGVGLVAMSDVAVASRTAYFLLPYRNLGVSPDIGITWTLPRLIGWPRARRMLLFGERVPAETALEWGLVSEVVDDRDLEAVTSRYVEQLAHGPTFALGQMRRMLWDSFDDSHERHMVVELEATRACQGTEDYKIAGRAFRAKEKPDFIGR